MADSLITLNARDLKGGIVVGLVIVVSLTFAWFGIRWQLGSMLAELTSANDPSAKTVSEAARNLSPSDPLAAWLYANSSPVADTSTSPIVSSTYGNTCHTMETRSPPSIAN